MGKQDLLECAVETVWICSTLICWEGNFVVWAIFLDFELRKGAWESKKNQGKVKRRSNLKNSILCDGLLYCSSGIFLPKGLEISRDLPLQANTTQILNKGFDWHPHKDLAQYKS